MEETLAGGPSCLLASVTFALTIENSDYGDAFSARKAGAFAGGWRLSLAMPAGRTWLVLHLFRFSWQTGGTADGEVPTALFGCPRSQNQRHKLYAVTTLVNSCSRRCPQARRPAARAAPRRGSTAAAPCGGAGIDNGGWRPSR